MCSEKALSYATVFTKQFDASINGKLVTTDPAEKISLSRLYNLF